MRVALFGSPAFALPVLKALLTRHVVALVVAQPDKPAGRGNKLTPPPVAVRARELGLKLEQPARLKRNEAFFKLVRDLDLDVAVTAAYGKILPQALLDIPGHGFLNVHASLLPKYRGAAPIQWALISGETETGVSIMQTEAGLDTGPVRLVRRLTIDPDDTAGTLLGKLSVLGADALVGALSGLEGDALPCTPQAQDDAQATHAPMLSKDDGAIRWNEPAAQIYNRFRGVSIWPGTWTVHDGRVLKVPQLTPLPSVHGEPGGVVAVSPEGVTVGSGEGAALLQTVQPAGKPRMPARDWANGYGVKVGTRLGGEHG